jgi:hypothetical protein
MIKRILTIAAVAAALGLNAAFPAKAALGINGTQVTGIALQELKVSSIGLQGVEVVAMRDCESGTATTAGGPFEECP